jgi:hypothetical protein
MIATLFGKKKMTEDKLSNVFVNAVLELTDQGFPMVAEELNESPEFEVSPDLDPADDARFAMVVLAGNLLEMERVVGPGLDKRLFSLSISKFAQAFDRTGTDMEDEIRALQGRMERINYPSKNTARAMSAVLFQEYELFCFQDIYFREQRSPNPIILKRINNLMGYFLWSWTEVLEQYRVV